MLGFAAPAGAQHPYAPDAKLFPAKAEKYGVGLTERYLRLWKRTGPAQAGANLVISGAPKAKVAESADRLARWLNPPPVYPGNTESVATSPSEAVSTSSGYTGSTPPDYIAQCESGGSYTAVNPSSGAYGRWQILPSTASSYGCDLSSPAGQDACASEIYSDVGASAWVCG